MQPVEGLFVEVGPQKILLIGSLTVTVSSSNNLKWFVDSLYTYWNSSRSKLQT